LTVRITRPLLCNHRLPTRRMWSLSSSLQSFIWTRELSASCQTISNSSCNNQQRSQTAGL
jgi:hypothetical protein